MKIENNCVNVLIANELGHAGDFTLGLLLYSYSCFSWMDISLSVQL